MPVIAVPLNDVATKRLHDLAQRDRRRPADQAAVLLERTLARLGQRRDEHPAETARASGGAD